MSARLRTSLHPLTVASIGMQRDNCCDRHSSPLDRWSRTRVDSWRLCDYHQGFQDGIEALLESEGRT